MAEVLFLDGPLAGQRREVPERNGEPLWSTFVVESAAGWLPDGAAAVIEATRVEYRFKPNRLSYGPRWVGAIGQRVGDQVVCVQTYSKEGRDEFGAAWLDDRLADYARDSLGQICAEAGLAAAEVHEVWRGTRREARETVRANPEGFPGAIHGLQAADSVEATDGLVFVVHEAVALPAEAVAA
ncbi:hypothetical protein I5H06_gp14 [Mycobacterium phage SirPhilip]|uniref:Uncharacterized protein n=1 Tax=Mycobacterium phage SirPhilip TaxID=2015824 RepID=A0A222ZMN9_9CAUD|nr:hypothetical protein I5H06_gp14 [Mycobacterium phage SirPhilip]ASR85290.1 hypothetical protein SEA_SIRPHILIP_88 [Mycobacterium phage SirPhilip]